MRTTNRTRDSRTSKHYFRIQVARRVLRYFLLSVAVLSVLSVAWEYWTRAYLKGFSDAILPASSSPQEEIASILNWMSRGPARQEGEPADLLAERNPNDTLNYKALLRVCGSATNAFINLADSIGLPARRLLLLDSRGSTMHVVAEVWVGSRWIVVDPAFRVILRGVDGEPLTREQLTNRVIFAGATRGIPGYGSEYDFRETSHLHLGRLGPVGVSLNRALQRSNPNWDSSPTLSMLVERESLGISFVAVSLFILLSMLSVAARIYGKRLSNRDAWEPACEPTELQSGVTIGDIS
jgi:hypothetical protein